MNLLSNAMNKYSSIPLPMKASIVFVFASLITQGLSIITLPIFTRIMDPSDIGVVTLYNSWEMLIGIVAGLALGSGSFNIGMMEFKEERDEYIASILNLSSLSAFVLFVFYFIFHEQIQPFIGFSSELIYLMFLGFILAPAMNFWMLKQRYEYKYKAVALVTVMTAVLSSILAVLAVLFVNDFVEGSYPLGDIRVFATKAIPFIVGAVLYASFIFRSKVFMKKKYLVFAITLSLPLLVHTLAKQLLDVSDRIMIERLQGLTEVGIYGVLYTLSALSLIVWNAINASLVPFMFKKLELGLDNAAKINAVVKPLITFYFVFCIFLILVAPEVVQILATKEYYDAIYLMPPIAAGIFFTSLYNVFSNVLLFYKKTKLIMIATLIAVVVNIGLNFIFIPIFGFVAAAYTTLLSYLILAGLQYIFMKKILSGAPLFDDKYLWMIALLMIVLALVLNITYEFNILRYFIIVAIVVGAVVKRKSIIKGFLRAKDR
ncbi:oligosaccharide flippase family protein [Litchfieldia salsa]|uniref:Membrane protein involved in the export of O-antigen and teichoic acid n=1 Tax=Litchfieldia salsa TaxID=930152 RepID=A0A1H0W4S2_9BACI|nr:polysaccharide biosynthesis C-terminal domain-containing protein [Litchfieldia salsa]SDP85722.1 Membrane protein involved in the export of O-antigen and teichoic acid [Litchfieldia salsa]